MTWLQAGEHCVQKGKALAVPTSESSNAEIMSVCKSSIAGHDSCWLGGAMGVMTNPSDIGWIEVDPYQRPTLWNNFTRWAAGEPNGAGDARMVCVQMYADGAVCGRDGSWADVSCDDLLPIVCEKTDESCCTPALVVDHMVTDGTPAPTPAPELGHCSVGFFPMSSKKTWADARADCLSRGMDLAVPRSKDDKTGKEINNLIMSACNTAQVNDDACWIGGKTSNIYTLEWVDGNTDTFTMWDRGEPNGVNEDVGCVEMFGDGAVSGTDGKWNDVQCDFQLPYICECLSAPPAPPPAPPAPTPAPCGDDRFFPVDEYKTWEDARADCLSRGLDLAVPRGKYDKTGKEINSLIMSACDTLKHDTCWIGGKTSNTDTLEWVDGNMDTFTMWDRGEPNGVDATGSGCVEMFGTVSGTGGKWNDVKCDFQLPYICECH